VRENTAWIKFEPKFKSLKEIVELLFDIPGETLGCAFVKKNKVSRVKPAIQAASSHKGIYSTDCFL
jgi:hypothetical protein